MAFLEPRGVVYESWQRSAKARRAWECCSGVHFNPTESPQSLSKKRRVGWGTWSFPKSVEVSPAGFVHGFGGSGLWLGFGLVWGLGLFLFCGGCLVSFPLCPLLFPLRMELSSINPFMGCHKSPRLLVMIRTSVCFWLPLAPGNEMQKVPGRGGRGGFFILGVNLTVPAVLRWRRAA